MKIFRRFFGTTMALAGGTMFATSCGDATRVISPAIEVGAPVSANVSNRGWIHGRDGLPVEVTYEVVDGMAVLEGDMILGRHGTVPRTRRELVARRSANLSFISSAGGTRWPNGVVPYVLSSSFTSSEQSSIHAGIAMINQAAFGVNIRPKVSSDLSWVHVHKVADGCSSLVGRVGGEQGLWLTSDCAGRAGTVAHEFLHALGAFHEQSRCDRDTYVTVNWSNIRPEKHDNFQKMCSGANDYLEYDEASVMHYPSHTSNQAFVYNVYLPMLTSKRGRPMGNRDSLVSVDRRTINALYPPPSPDVTVAYDANGHPVFSWANLPGVQYYRIFYTTSHHFYSPEYGTLMWEGTTYPGWTTTASTWTDFSKQYNGSSEVCYYNNPEVPEEEWRSYGYAVEAVYAEATARTLTSAAVFVCPPY